jgi:hypothetical protein
MWPSIRTIASLSFYAATTTVADDQWPRLVIVAAPSREHSPSLSSESRHGFLSRRLT